MCIRDRPYPKPIRPGLSVCLYLELEVGKGRIKALVDSGSARCLISSCVYQQLVRESLIKASALSSVVCWTASREVLPTSKLVAFKIKINYISWVWEFLVAPNLSVDCILGADFIAKSGLVLDIQAVSYTHLDVYKRQLL